MPIGTRDSENTRTEMERPLDCLLKVAYGVVYGIVWILLFGFTLVGLGTVLTEHLVAPMAQQGYGALLVLAGVFWFMPLDCWSPSSFSACRNERGSSLSWPSFWLQRSPLGRL
jgi:hypothetical protein